jgi:bacterioferritin
MGREGDETMKGNPEVIAALNEALKEELLAINQYFLHAEMCENWKYEVLSKYIKHQSIDEMKHAEKLIERILFLDATPSIVGPSQLGVGKNVKEQIANDLALELGAVELYNRAIKLSREKADNATAELLQGILKDEEDHVDFLESQLHLIEEIGYERYLSKQMGEE